MPNRAVLHVLADRKKLAQIRAFVEEQATSASASEQETSDLVQAADEAATNIIMHGYKDGPGVIEIEICHQAGKFVITFRDSAPIFDPTDVGTPNIHLPLEQRVPGGLGIYLIRQCVDEIIHHPRDSRGNELTLVKHLQV